MSDLAALADELERRVFEMGRSPRPENDAISLGFYIAGQVQALLSALRASRPESKSVMQKATDPVSDSNCPEPAADAVEAVWQIYEAEVAKMCRERGFAGPEDRKRAIAAALSALPRPSDAGAVEALAEAIARAISCHGDPPAICDCFGACDCTDEARKIIAALPRPEVDEAAVERAAVVSWLDARARHLRSQPGGAVEATMAEDFASAIERGDHRSAALAAAQSPTNTAGD